MPQLEHIDAIERRLWSAADTLRANSKYASNEYFLPVMGLVFLRHAYSRYLAVRDEIEAGLPTRGGRKRTVTREDFAQKNALFLRLEAQFDHLVALPDGKDRVAAVIAAMESIEADYASLRGVLPKSEYQALDNEVLGDLLRKLNPDELKQVSGDVFGRIYEYFLTNFSPEQQQNLLAIVWLYRGDTARFRDLAFGYLLDVVEEGVACIQWEGADGQVRRPLEDFLDALAALRDALSLFLETQAQTGPHADRSAELDREQERFARDAEHFGRRVDEAAEQWEETAETNDGLNELVDRFAPLVESSRNLAGQADQLCKAALRLIETCERASVPPGPATSGTAATSPAPARPPTRPGEKPSNSSGRSATSGVRPTGSPNASPTASCATWKGWSSSWTGPRSKPTTGA